MDQLTGIRAFLRVVDEGGFAAAARSLGVTRSVINKRVNYLEGELGIALLTRSTRHVATTDAGYAFYQRARDLVTEFDDAMTLASDAASEPSGTLRVNAPMSYGQLCVLPVVARLIAASPKLRIELVLNDRRVDPLEEGFDVTVRVGVQEHLTSLVSVELGFARRMIVAAPSYLEQSGMPTEPKDLRQHACLHYGYQQSGSAWPVTTQGGEQSIAINCVLSSNNGDVLRDAAIAGAGIALLPDFIVEAAVADGSLTPVLHDFAPAPLAITALHPRHRHISGAQRAFLAELARPGS